jgi:hypothetical protein
MGSLALAGAAMLLMSCGGGTEVAPASPVVEGPGSAAVRLGGNDLGATQLVSAGIADQATVLTAVTGELVTFSAATPSIARLAHGGVAPNPSPALYSDPPPPPVATYNRGVDELSCGPCDYWVHNVAGVLQRNPSGAVPTGTPVPFDYTYNARLLEVSVGVAFSAGSSIRIIVHNVPSDAGPTITATRVTEARIGASPQPVTFWVIATTGLNTPVPVTQTAVDDPANQIVIDQLDLTNEGNPCVGGHFTVNVRQTLTDPLVLLDGDFVAPGC